MPPRPYDNSARQNAQAETIRRIIDATVGLHAEKGGMATTHADIAQRAGVSVATVYKHFPSREALLPHCMGAVEMAAPPLDAAQLLALPPSGRIPALVRTLHARYRYLHPWIRWAPGDAASSPTLAQAMNAAQMEIEQVIRTVLESCAGGALPPPSMALAYVLLGYPAWQRVESESGDPEQTGRTIEQVVQLLISKPSSERG